MGEFLGTYRSYTIYTYQLAINLDLPTPTNQSAAGGNVSRLKFQVFRLGSAPWSWRIATLRRRDGVSSTLARIRLWSSMVPWSLCFGSSKLLRWNRWNRQRLRVFLYGFTGSVRFRMLAPRILHRQVAPVFLDLTRPRNQMVDLAQVPHGHREMVWESVSCRTLLILIYIYIILILW